MPSLRFNPEYNPFRVDYWLGSIDSRPVAAFRMFYGALLLKDAVYHVPIARTFYSDEGIFPRQALFNQAFGPFRFSLMDALGPPALVVGFFLAWAVVAACLMVGYRARLAAFLNFLILVSVQYRNGYVLDGSDALFRVFGFWAIFLPLGDHYAIDGLRRRIATRALGGEEQPSAKAWALPIRLFQLQIAIIYLATAAIKLRSGIWLEGDALFYTVQLKSLMLPTGEGLFEAAPPALLRAGSVAVVLVEWAFAFLVLSPIGQPALRLAGLTLGALLHAGIAVTMSIPNFSLLMMSSYWLFARGEWVEGITRRLRSERHAAELALPEPGAPIWPWALSARNVSFVAPAARYEEVDGWWIGHPDGGRETGAVAWSRLAGHLTPSPFWRALFASARLRSGLWRAGAAWTRRAMRGGPVPAAARSPSAARPALGVALVLVMASVAWHNAWTAYYPLVPPVRGLALDALLYLALGQNWNMFLAGGRRPDGWVEVAGAFEDGRVLDLRRGGSPSEEMPRWHIGPWARWKMLDRAVDALPPPHLSAWANYYCRAYAARGSAPGRRLAVVELRHRFRMPHAPGAPPEPLQTRVLWRQSCAPTAPLTTSK